jgi:hypothetical protein
LLPSLVPYLQVREEVHHIPHLTLLVRVEAPPIQPKAQDVRISFSRSIFAPWVDVRENIAAERNEFLRCTERAMGTSFAANVALLFVLVLKKRIQGMASHFGLPRSGVSLS